LFQSALQSANPDETKVGGYTVRELLQDISTGLSGQFADQPEVEIELRRTIGLAFRRLGSAEQADPHFKTALALARKAYGPEHNKVAEILVGYGNTAGDRGRTKEAEEAFCDAARIYRLNGTTGRPLVIALWRYEVFLAGSGRDREAVAVAHEALDLARASGTEFPEVPSILHKLAEVKVHQNECAEAEELAQHAMEVHRRLNGTEGLETAWGAISLGMALDANGKFVQAEAAYREALTIFRLHYDSHRSIRMALDGIKRALRAQNDTAALEALQREQQEWTVFAMNRRAINSLISEIRTAPSSSQAVAQAEQVATIAKYASRRQREEIGAAILQYARETFHSWNGDFPSAQRLTQLALDVYRSLARAYPNEPNLLGHTDSLCLLGDIEMELGKLEECEQTAREAQTAIDDAIKSFPHNRDLRKNQAESHRLLGNALREKGATDEALQQCRQAVEIASQLNQEVTDTSAFTERLTFSKLSLADALLRADQFNEAATEYRSSLTFNENAAIRFPKDTWTGELASKCIRQLATTLPAHAKDHPKEAAQALQLFAFALRQLKQLNAGTAPEHLAVRMCLAKGYFYAIPLLAAEPDWAVALEQAEQDFHGLLADFPNSDGGRANVGWAWIFHVRSFSFEPRNLPHLERAIQGADRVFKLHSDDKAFDANIWCQFASEHVQLGDLYVQVGRADKAEDAFRKAIALCDEHAQSNSMARAQLYVTLASFLAGAGRSTDSDVADLYQKAMALARDNANACNALAWMLATTSAPDQKNANKNRALDFAQQAVRLSPRDGSNWNTLGVARYRAGDWPSAVKALEKSIDLRGGGDAFDWFFLAMAHWQLGQKDEARKWYDQAVEWTKKNLPKNEELQRFRAEAAELLRVTQPQPATELTRPN
jgi:tetratricopeptide (TPR) repeat protein